MKDNLEQRNARSVGEYIVGMGLAVRALGGFAVDVVRYIPHFGRDIKDAITDEYGKSLRSSYKHAVLEPYIDQLPIKVIEVMLDIDLFDRDEDGNKITPLYKLRKKHGEVQATIDRVHRSIITHDVRH